MFFPVLIAAATMTSSPWYPVPVVDMNQYLGHWYQAYSDLAVTATFENSSTCVTADYGLNSNGTISVWNRERQYSVTGPSRDIFGWAEATNTSRPGELTVHLQGTGNFGAPYWIFELGPSVPVDANGTTGYAYSVVSDPFHLTLFVLARNLTEFAETWADGVLGRLTAAGYTGWLNTPTATIQEGCADV
jgi:lipocalin